MILKRIGSSVIIGFGMRLEFALSPPETLSFFDSGRVAQLAEQVTLNH